MNEPCRQRSLALLSFARLSEPLPQAAAEQREQVRLRLGEHLELIATGSAVLELKGLERYPITEEIQPKVQSMRLPSSIRHLDGLKIDLLKIEFPQIRYLFVEAAATEVSIPRLDRAKVHAVVADDRRSTGMAIHALVSWGRLGFQRAFFRVKSWCPCPLCLFHWPARPHQMGLRLCNILSIERAEEIAKPGDADEELISNVGP